MCRISLEVDAGQGCRHLRSRILHRHLFVPGGRDWAKRSALSVSFTHRVYKYCDVVSTAQKSNFSSHTRLHRILNLTTSLERLILTAVTKLSADSTTSQRHTLTLGVRAAGGRQEVTDVTDFLRLKNAISKFGLNSAQRSCLTMVNVELW